MHHHKKKFWSKKMFQDIVCPRGGTAVIDSFCWLHDCGRGVGRMMYQAPDLGKALIIKRFFVLLQIVQASGGRHKWIPHCVFDSSPSPAKAAEDSARRAKRAECLKKALVLERLKKGTTTEAHKLYNNWWRPSHELVHEICSMLSEQCIRYTVAPYEADGQISYICNQAAPGTTIALTKDSDLAVTVNWVFFWDRQYDNDRRIGGGLECIRSVMLSKRDGKKSMVGFTDRQFTLVCVCFAAVTMSRRRITRVVLVSLAQYQLFENTNTWNQ